MQTIVKLLTYIQADLGANDNCLELTGGSCGKYNSKHDKPICVFGQYAYLANWRLWGDNLLRSSRYVFLEH